MLTLPPDSELFQMVPSLEQSQADQNRFRLTFSRHSDFPHVYRVYPSSHSFPEDSDDISITYERALAQQAAKASEELKGFHGDAFGKIYDVNSDATILFKSAIRKHLQDHQGKIVRFPFAASRYLWSGVSFSVNEPNKKFPQNIFVEPFPFKDHYELEYLQKYLNHSYPVRYVNPFRTWARVHKVIFIATFILYFLSYALVLHPALFSAYSLVQGSVFCLGLLNLIPMFISRNKSAHWEATTGKVSPQYTGYQELFRSTALGYHRELRFYRLWVQHAGRELHPDFDKWEKQLHSLVDQFNNLPTEPKILH